MRVQFAGITAMLDCTPEFKVGDPCPDGYIARQEWAEVHLAAGLKQVECCKCGLWKFPHQLSDTIVKTPAIRETRVNRRKHFENVILEYRVCKECDK